MAISPSSKTPGWESVAHEIGLWSVQSTLPSGMPHRTCALRLKTKGFLIIGPSATMSKRAHAELKRMGKIDAVLAANHFNDAGMVAFCKEHPGAVPIATKPARARLVAKTGLPLEGMEKLRGSMPGPGMLHVPSGLKTGEIWVKVSMRRGRGWIVGDAFNTMAHLPSGLKGLYLRMMLAAPGLRISRGFVSRSVNDIGVYRAWVFNRLREDRPTMVISTGGDVMIHSDLPTRIKHVIDARLGT